MCIVLQISRSLYYYEAKERRSEDDVTGAVIEIFEQNRSAYGTREIIGFSTSLNKDFSLVARAFSSIQGDLRDI